MQKALVVGSLLVAAMGAGTLAQAQERLQILGFGGPSPVMAEVDAGVSQFGTVRRVTPVDIEPAASPGSVQAVAGGRYLVWVTPKQNPQDPAWFAVFDRRSQTLATVPARGGLLVDRFRPRVFILGASITVYDLRTGVERVAAETLWDRQRVVHAASADRLAILESQMTPTGLDLRVRVVDVPGATTVALIGLPPQPLLSAALGLEITDDGSRVYVSEHDGTIVARDAISGVELARSAPQVYGPGVLDRERHFLLVPSSQGRLKVLQSETLQLLADLPVATGADSFAVLSGRDNTGAYVLRSRLTGPARTDCEVDLDALDLSGQRRATTRLSGALNGRTPWCVAGFSGAAVLRNPSPPTGLAAHVSGSAVTLTWQAPGDATDFEVEVGMAPGATTARYAVGDTTVTGASNVPPGVYYVRVRARNEVGGSGPSTEIAVVVP